MSLEETTLKFGQEAFDNVKAELGERWALLTDAQKASAERSARRVIQLKVKRVKLQAAGEDLTEVDSDLEFVRVTVGEFKLAGQIAATDTFQDAFWKGVNKAVEALGSFLAGAGKSLIPGLGEFLGD